MSCITTTPTTSSTSSRSLAFLNSLNARGNQLLAHPGQCGKRQRHQGSRKAYFGGWWVYFLALSSDLWQPAWVGTPRHPDIPDWLRFPRLVEVSVEFILFFIQDIVEGNQWDFNLGGGWPCGPPIGSIFSPFCVYSSPPPDGLAFDVILSASAKCKKGLHAFCLLLVGI